MKKNIAILMAGICLVVLSCEKNIELDFPKTNSQIVVDGWIEQGRSPITKNEGILGVVKIC